MLIYIVLERTMEHKQIVVARKAFVSLDKAIAYRDQQLREDAYGTYNYFIDSAYLDDEQ